jgi:hypothetical protein
VAQEKPALNTVKYLGNMTSTVDLVQWKAHVEFNLTLDE